MAEPLVTAYQDALQSLRRFFPNPVRGQDAAYHALGEDRVLSASGALAVLFMAMTFLGTYLILPSFVRSQAKVFFYVLLLSAAGPASLAAVGALAQKVFTGKAEISSCAFVAASSALPMGIWTLLTGVLGAANFEAVAALGVFAVCYTVLMLYSGCIQILKLSEGQATLSVPVMLLLSAWVTKVLFVAAL